jgi:glycosyltransferase involved in cell wall biosynthesis
MKLSIIIPAYNEEKTLLTIIEKVLNFKLPNNIEKEILILNDASKDKTPEIIDQLAKKHKEIKAIHNEKNLGKSQTVRKGILESTGDLIVIQDADLEYEPEEISLLVEKLQEENLDVVYGNRFGKKNKVIYIQNFLGNKFLSLISNIFTYLRIRKWIPDMEVCYKLINGEVARELAQNLTAKSNFGFEPEITAKLSRYKKAKGSHLKFGIVPISYHPRTIEEGKKMKAISDGFKALKEIITYNLF